MFSRAKIQCMTHQTGQTLKHRATDQAAVFDALGLRTRCVITSLMTVLFTFSVFPRTNCSISSALLRWWLAVSWLHTGSEDMRTKVQEGSLQTLFRTSHLFENPSFWEVLMHQDVVPDPSCVCESLLKIWIILWLLTVENKASSRRISPSQNLSKMNLKVSRLVEFSAHVSSEKPLWSRWSTADQKTLTCPQDYQTYCLNIAISDWTSKTEGCV